MSEYNTLRQITPFFSIAENQDLFNKITDKIAEIAKKEPNDEIMQKIHGTFHDFFKARGVYNTDNYCQLNISAVGNKFIEKIQLILNISDNNEVCKNIELIYIFLIRFIVEYEYSAPYSIDNYLYIHLNWAKENIEKFSESSQFQLNFAFGKMPLLIIQKLINEAEIAKDDIQRDIGISIKQIKEFKEEIEKSKEEIKAFKKYLDEQKTDFNFVALSKGFEDILRTKKTTLCWLVWGLFSLGIIVLIPPLLYIFTFFGKNPFGSIDAKYIADILTININHIPYSLITSISWVIITFDYFRIVLNEYKAIQYVILQLELRLNLYRFIKNYTEVAKDIQSNRSQSLDKFENIIFSGLVRDESKLPTTLDSVDLNKIFESFTKNRKP